MTDIDRQLWEIDEKTGMSKRTINEHLSRAKAIPEDVRDQIKGTKLDTGTYLDWLKGMDPDRAPR